MNGEYLRVTADELAHAIEDPAWAREFASEISEAEEFDEVAPAPPERLLTSHKAWHAIAFLLDRGGFPVDVVYGEEQFTDEDCGYGPPRYLTVERVRVAAAALAATSFRVFTDGVSPTDLARADIYPQVWDEPDSLEWVQAWYEPLVPYFTAAAEQGQAIIIWLD
jgi:hypothetical protein